MSPLFFVLSSCLATLVTSKTAPLMSLEEHEEHLQFEHFIQKHNKEYINEEEKLLRFEIFKANLREANILNQQIGRTLFGITQFMDLSREEFVEQYTCVIPPTNLTEQACTVVTDDQIPDTNAPESFDWRDRNAVTRIKNQKGCGSCYAFSASGNIEGQYAIKHKVLLELSEQQTVDCDTNSNGCDGGLMSTAFRKMIQQGGIESESDYPYVGSQQSCQFTAGKAAVRLTDCYSYNLASQEKLKQLVYKVGPISVAVKGAGFHKYFGGVLLDDHCNDGPVNHAVLLVGYGTENGMPYWLIKNSWDVTFGEQGYIKIQRGESQSSCGMMNDGMASSVVM